MCMLTNISKFLPSTVASTNEFLPLDEIGIGVGVESGGVRYTNVKIVPRCSLDCEARYILHRRHIEEAGPPELIRIRQPTKVPRDPAQN